MDGIRILSEKDGVREVTDGKSTWKEYPPRKRSLVEWIENEVLFCPNKWYTKTLAFLFHWLILIPLLIPLYQVALIYFVSPWVGLGGWSWWQIVIKLIILVILWLPSIILLIWAAQSSVGENSIDLDDL